MLNLTRAAFLTSMLFEFFCDLFPRPVQSLAGTALYSFDGFVRLALYVCSCGVVFGKEDGARLGKLGRETFVRTLTSPSEGVTLLFSTSGVGKALDMGSSGLGGGDCEPHGLIQGSC